MDREVQKRVHMGKPAKGWRRGMLVHNIGLGKAWARPCGAVVCYIWPAQGLVGQWVGGLGKAKCRTPSHMSEDNGQMQNQYI